MLGWKRIRNPHEVIRHGVCCFEIMTTKAHGNGVIFAGFHARLLPMLHAFLQPPFLGFKGVRYKQTLDYILKICMGTNKFSNMQVEGQRLMLRDVLDSIH